MSSRPFNLATRPFRNERLPALLLGVGWLLLLALTLWHAVSLRRLGPAYTGGLHREMAELEGRLKRLETRAAGFQVAVSDTQLKEWAFVKDLVDRRAFSWTRLLHELEQTLPPGTRVKRLSPTPTAQGLELQFEAGVRSAEEGLELVRSLEARPAFDSVNPRSSRQGSEGGTRTLQCDMRYLPQPEPAAPPAGRRKARAPAAAEVEP